jgi:hypothetical protein
MYRKGKCVGNELHSVLPVCILQVCLHIQYSTDGHQSTVLDCSFGQDCSVGWSCIVTAQMHTKMNPDTVCNVMASVTSLRGLTEGRGVRLRVTMGEQGFSDTENVDEALTAKLEGDEREGGSGSMGSQADGIRK